MTLPAYKLEEAGFKRNQVEALTEFFGANSASKTDLLELKIDLKGDIAGFRTKFDTDIASLRSDIVDIRGTAKLHFWMLSILLTFVVMIAGKLLLL